VTLPSDPPSARGPQSPAPVPDSVGLANDVLQKRIVEELRRSVRKEHFEPWFRDLRVAASSPGRCVFTVPSSFVRDWLRRNYLTQFAAAVRAIPGYEHCAVSIESEAAIPSSTRERLARSVERYDARSVAARLAADGTYGAIHDAFVGSPRAQHESHSGNGAAQGGSTNGSPRGSGSPSGSEGVTVGSTSREPGFVDPSLRDFEPSLRGDPDPEFPMNQPRDGEAARANQDPDGAMDRTGRFERGPGDRGPGERVNPAERSGSSLPRRMGDTPGVCELNTNYTFDQFVVGPCNRLSHAAALAVGDNPGRAYNPLFVHGNVGLGKTHLLQAICHEIRRKDEHARVLYLSCEEFTNRFIHAIQSGRLDDFRNLHRTADVLVIDDIQFLAGKDKTQDEFFHTFNALYNANRQIVLSSDRAPTEIPTVEERLVSRFKWGLVVEMEVPCLETRAAIVRRKARSKQIDLPEDVAFVIAKRVDTNIRELEGAITKVLGVAQITGRPITVELVGEALRGVVSQRSRPISVSDVVNLVSTEFSIAARELTGKGRTQTVSQPRQICMYLLRQVTDLSYEEIGGYFGDRDHTTVLYAVKRMDRRTKEDRMFRDLVQKLMSRLRG
jgi:chromosomal replication initiator protein